MRPMEMGTEWGSSKQIWKKEEGERLPENPTQKQSAAGIGEIQQQPDGGCWGGRVEAEAGEEGDDAGYDEAGSAEVRVGPKMADDGRLKAEEEREDRERREREIKYIYIYIFNFRIKTTSF
ncbi:hypothetical protein C2S52_011351 [Perilla frutescens var. hirtella]|nr:hypothetical protein C2S52_011351 [Perilla frutescens var. hirtella]